MLHRCLRPQRESITTNIIDRTLDDAAGFICNRAILNKKVTNRLESTQRSTFIH